MWLIKVLKMHFSIFLIFLYCGAASHAQAVDKSIEDLTKALENLAETTVDQDEILRNLLSQMRRLLQPDNAELQAQLEKAASNVAANKQNKTLTTQVEMLRQAVKDYQKTSDEKAYFQTLMDEVIELLPQRKATLDDTAYTKLLAALTEMEKVEDQRKVEAARREAVRLNGLLLQTPSIMNGNDRINLTTLQATMLTIEANNFATAFTAAVTRLKARLAPNDLVKSRLTTAQKTELTGLITEINKVLPQKIEPSVHVVSAYWGRLSGSSGGGCDATPALRKKCQGKATCQLPANWQSLFCGGSDPAPFAEATNKGLLLRYICLSADAQKWEDVLAKKDVLTTEDKRQTVVFRTTNDQIQCRAPG